MDSVDAMAAARVLDASANRACEAVRVLEDYARFVRNDEFVTRTLKEFRHDLSAVLAALPATQLLAARETIQDVGTAIQTEQEGYRGSLRDIVSANAKRLQEALRTLEEFGKLLGPGIGAKLESLRYRGYTIQRLVLLADVSHSRLAEARLYLLLSGADVKKDLEFTVREAIAGGAGIIQLREKSLSDRMLLKRAREVRHWTLESRALFIVNDRPDIARLADADGVHLGQDDVSVFDARKIVGPDALVGVSTHTIDQLRTAILDGASYVGVGPTFTSITKSFDSLAGLDFVRAATAETALPAFILGGVTTRNVCEVVAAGGRKIAVSAAVAQADDPRRAAAELCAALTLNRPEMKNLS
ncbi:MAG: thiamine phosphate synthase [Gemmataceae bacterium]